MNNTTNNLPPELQAFASLLDAQPSGVQEAFQFLLATAMHEAGKFKLVSVAGVDGRWHYTFSGAGEVFSVVRTDVRKEMERKLDAAYFHLYGIARDDVDYIMDTFPIVKRKDEAAHGEYRTKRVILEIYDAMQQAIKTGQPCQALFDPPPADPRVAHPPRNESDVLARMEG